MSKALDAVLATIDACFNESRDDSLVPTDEVPEVPCADRDCDQPASPSSMAGFCEDHSWFAVVGGAW